MPAPRVEGELPRAAARLLDLLGDQLRRLLLRDALRGTTRAHARCGLTSFSESTGVARAVHGREPGPRRRGRQCVCGCGLCVARAHLLLHAQVELEGALCITDGRAELAQRGVEVGEVRRSDRRRRWRRSGADAAALLPRRFRYASAAAASSARRAVPARMTTSAWPSVSSRCADCRGRRRQTRCARERERDPTRVWNRDGASVHVRPGVRREARACACPCARRGS